MLEVKNLSINIENGSKLFSPVDGISFTINAGEIIGLAGESGCGKTLTALSIMRLLPPAIKTSGGEIIFNSANAEKSNLCSLDEESLRRIRGKEIAMIFQEPRQSLNPLIKVGAQIAETLELHGTACSTRTACGTRAEKQTANAAALELLHKFNIPDVWPHQLSGGMCQRVMIAIAAICRPRLLIADEPLTALDTENQNHILSMLTHINREFGTAILFISHDLPLAKDFCSRFLVMQKGRIIEHGPSKKIFESPVHPYTKELFGALVCEKKHISVLSFTDDEMKRKKQDTLPLTHDASTVISIRNLSCAYVSRNFGLFGKKKVKPVLNNINLDIAAGEIFGLSGESGCGKTTLARCILGLTAYEGHITVNGQAQMVFQDPGASLNPVKKIGWLMEEPLIIHKIGAPKERSQKVDEMLRRIGLDPAYKTRRVHELSGGQKQRICIGRALMLNSKILIADEAISSLDVSVGAQILNLFLELHESLGLTIIFISHNKSAVEYLCGRAAVMSNGKLTFAPATS